MTKQQSSKQQSGVQYVKKQSSAIQTITDQEIKKGI